MSASPRQLVLNLDGECVIQDTLFTPANADAVIKGVSINGTGVQLLAARVGGTGNASFADGQFVQYSASRQAIVSSGIGPGNIPAAPFFTQMAVNGIGGTGVVKFTAGTSNWPTATPLYVMTTSPAPTVSNGGTGGFVVGDVLTYSDANTVVPAQATVLSAPGGIVASVHNCVAGLETVNPSSLNPITFTGGSGTGAVTLSTTWSSDAAHVTLSDTSPLPPLSVVASGSYQNYNLGDILFVGSGSGVSGTAVIPAELLVTGVFGNGNVNAVSVLTGGIYSTYPTGNISTNYGNSPSAINWNGGPAIRVASRSVSLPAGCTTWVWFRLVFGSFYDAPGNVNGNYLFSKVALKSDSVSPVGLVSSPAFGNYINYQSSPDGLAAPITFLAEGPAPAGHQNDPALVASLYMYSSEACYEQPGNRSLYLVGYAK